MTTRHAILLASGLLNAVALGFGLSLVAHLKKQVQTPKPKEAVIGRIGTTNIVDNGLASWAAETNHTFGPKMARNIYVLQHPDGKFYIRYRENTNEPFAVVFQSDTAYRTADDARLMFSLNVALLTDKAICDALENALK